MRALKLFTALLLIAVLSACVPTLSFHPWFTESDWESEPALVGTWTDAETVLVIESEGDRKYVLSFTSDGRTSRFETRVMRRGRFYLLDVQADTEAMKSLLKNEFWLPIVFTRFLGRIELRGDTLLLSQFSDLADAIQAGEIPVPHLVHDDTVILTAGTPALRELALQYAEESSTDGQAFKKIGLFHRQPEEVGHFHRGEQFREVGRYPEAQAAYQQALALRPDYFEAIGGAAWLQLQQGFYQKAVELFERAMAIEPDDAALRRQLAFAYLAVGRNGQALVEYRVAARLNPSDAAALSGVARVSFLERRFADSIREFEAYLKATKNPFATDLLLHALALLHEDRRPEAMRFLAAYLRNHPHEPGSTHALGFYLGRTTETSLLKIAAGGVELCRIHFFVGYRYLLDGDLQAAREHFRQALATGEFDEFAYLAAAVRLRESGG